jgi:hypothetical protein
MTVAQKATPLAAVVAAISSLVCCMPLGLLGAVGLSGFALWAGKYRTWFVILAFLLLIVGGFQVYGSQGSCKKCNKGTMITFWIAVALVLFIFLFPQVIANVLAQVTQ